MSSSEHPAFFADTLACVSQALAAGSGTVTSSELAALGLGSGTIASLISGKVLTRVSRGAFVDTARLKAADPDGRHVLITIAIARSWPPGVMVSHTSAALMRRLPVLRRPTVVHGSRRGPGQFRRTKSYTIHTGYSGAGCSSIQGVDVIDPAFVVLGAAELGGRNEAVVVGDAALRLGQATIQEIRAAAETRRFHAVQPVIERAVELMDAGAESPGESLARLVLTTLGYTVQSQVVITDAAGFVGRVDLLIEGTKVIVEFDGMTKYAHVDDLVAEKRREVRLQRAGYVVVRLVWSDLNDPARVRAIVEAALEAQDRTIVA